MIENNEKQTELVGLLKKYAQATLTREKVQSMRGYLQHGDTTTLDHAIAVAYYSLMLDQKWKLNCDKGSLVRGALMKPAAVTSPRVIQSEGGKYESVKKKERHEHDPNN